MPNLHPQFHFIHLPDPNNLNVHIALEIATVILFQNKFLHFEFEELDIFECGPEIDGEGELFFHCFGAGDVFDPAGVEDDVGHLGDFVVVDVFEDGEEEGDAVDEEAGGVDVDAVADVVGVLDRLVFGFGVGWGEAYLDEEEDA